MKLLVVHNFYQEPGGEDVVFQSETALLERHGHEVVRYTSRNEVRNYRLTTLASKTIWNGASLHELRTLIRETGPDLLHVHNTFPLMSPSIYTAAWEEGVPVVQTLHNFRFLCPKATLYRDHRVCEDCVGTATYWPGIVHGCYRGSRVATGVTAAMLTTHTLLGTWRRRITRYIAISEFSKGKFVQGGWPSDRISVKPNFLSDDPGMRTAGGDYALFVGRLSEEKGLATLLDAFGRMSQPPRLKIAGQGPLMPADRQSYQNVEWLGHQSRERVVELMKGAAMLIVPSEWYETGVLTIIEAFATGLPVIASRLGTMAEMVTEGVTGLLFQPQDAQSLADAMAWALQHPAETAAMASRARAQFERKYAAEPNYRTLMEIYREAMN